MFGGDKKAYGRSPTGSRQGLEEPIRTAPSNTAACVVALDQGH